MKRADTCDVAAEDGLRGGALAGAIDSQAAAALSREATAALCSPAPDHGQAGRRTGAPDCGEPACVGASGAA